MIGPCISIMYEDFKDYINILDKIPRDIAIEIRLDNVDNHRVTIPRGLRDRTLILTIRTVEEGGRFKGDVDKLFKIYLEAVKLSPDYIDIGIGNKRIYEIMENARSQGIGLIISYHNPYETPSIEVLEDIYKRIHLLNPDIIKIVTYSRSREDNKRMVDFLLTHVNNKPLTAFCMGRLGVASRIANLVYGGAITYLALEGKETAEGQLTLTDYLILKEVLDGDD